MKKIILPLAMMFSLSACATIIDGDKQSIGINTSNGKRVTVSVDGKSVQTPATVTVKRGKQDLRVTTNDKDCANSTPVNRSVKLYFS